MIKINTFTRILICSLITMSVACNRHTNEIRLANNSLPEKFGLALSSEQQIVPFWKSHFSDTLLVQLIDSALKNNQELNITTQEITMLRNEIGAKKGEYLPFVSAGASADIEKVGRYTSQGANDANTEIVEGREFPEPLSNLRLQTQVSWELDVWHKLRSAKNSAVKRYLASIEGRKFMVTNLVKEIAGAYYELVALDNQLAITNEYIRIQNDALDVVKQQKQAARTTELAVRRFEAQLANTRSLRFDILQKRTEVENILNFLVGRFPQPVKRTTVDILSLQIDTVLVGIPSDLLLNRPDIREAELELESSKLDVQVARANFYPSFTLSSGVGFEAFNPTYFVKSPESLLYNIAGDAIGPLINRKAIKSTYNNANAKQLQAVYVYEQRILTAFVEVTNVLSRIDNLQQSFDLKQQRVNALNESVEISSILFKSARADYMEVLLTQRDALESKFELIETKQRQLNAYVTLYQVIGGGWR